MLTALRAPGQVDTRWLSEDIPYGLATWSQLGDRLGVKTPVIDALVTLASATLGQDFGSQTRDLSALGLDQLNDEAMRAYAVGVTG
jgi:opine dehydrogenase